MICKLCLEDKKLIKAHIYPDFFYKAIGLYFPDKKEQGRVHKAEISDSHFHYNENGLPTGVYDPNILCTQCDNSINEGFEIYAKSILFGTPSISRVPDPSTGAELITYFGIDYTKFKLFMLSIFWRASISDKFTFKLNSSENEEIRQMLVNKDPKDKDDYSVMLFYINDTEKRAQILTEIMPTTNKTGTHYYFIAGGYVFHFYPNKLQLPDGWREFLLDKNGVMKIIVHPEEQNAQLLNQFYGKQIYK